MQKLIFTTLAGAALLAAAPAAAQVAGGLTGRVGGNVQVQPPRTGPAVGHVGDTVGDARDLARGAVRDGRDLARDARPDADVNARANARADLRADRDGAEVDAALRTGVAVRSSDGADLGSIVEVTRNEAGRAVQFLVRSADGTLRMVPAGAVSVDGGVIVTGWTESQFQQHPADRR